MGRRQPCRNREPGYGNLATAGSDLLASWPEPSGGAAKSPRRCRAGRASAARQEPRPPLQPWRNTKAHHSASARAPMKASELFQPGWMMFGLPDLRPSRNTYELTDYHRLPPLPRIGPGLAWLTP